MALTTEQLLILNNLMYLTEGNGDCILNTGTNSDIDVGTWLQTLKDNGVPFGENAKMSPEEFDAVVNAALQDETICSMTIQATYQDNAGGGGTSALFISEATGDAAVVFCGTAGGEWKDNFEGGNVSDTQCQENALAWYQEIYGKYNLDQYETYVSGHSKGGNKAKYITIVDGNVDHCVSFDGQGFSDKFVDKYYDEIAARQGLIENHNLDHDFVNFLLNDFGTTTYYKGYGVDEFFENHSPNSFMNFNSDGTWSMEVNPDGRAEMIDALDLFVNGYLRSLPEDKRDAALDLIGTIAQGALGGKKYALSMDDFIQLALYGGQDDVAYLLAYFMEFGDEYGFDFLYEVLDDLGYGWVPSFMNVLTDIWDFELDFGLFTFSFEDLWEYMRTGQGIVGTILNFIGFNDLLAWILSHFVDFDLSGEDLHRFFELIGMTFDYTYEIEINDDDDDIVVSTKTSSGPFGIYNLMKFHIIVDANAVHSAQDELKAVADQMEKLIDDLNTVIDGINGSMSMSWVFKTSMKFTKLQMQVQRAQLLKMSDCLDFMLNNFQVSEEKIIAYMGEVVGS